jgi:cobyrinic acid a,c-diamide synthase
VRLVASGVLGKSGTLINGHEFHYASLTSAGDDEPFAEISDGKSKTSVATGGRRGRVTGAFFHAIAAAEA